METMLQLLPNGARKKYSVPQMPGREQLPCYCTAKSSNGSELRFSLPESGTDQVDIVPSVLIIFLSERLLEDR